MDQEAEVSAADLAIQGHSPKEYTFKQTKYGEHLPKCPFALVLCAPRSSGKTWAIVDMVVRLYKGVFERVYVWSPSVSVDSAWKPVKDYVQKSLHVDPEKETLFMDRWDDDEVGRLFNQQARIAQYQKEPLDGSRSTPCSGSSMTSPTRRRSRTERAEASTAAAG